MAKKITTKEQLTEFLLYTSPNGEIKVEAFLYNENVWLTQKRMSELFGKGRSTITEHLQNIFNEKELQEDLVSRNFRHTTQHGAIAGKKQIGNVKFYNLDAILSVGYRVNSVQATQFRIWASKILKEYIIKGFAMDDERLKNGRYFGKDYFQELLERVRSIRTSERRIYLKITDIFAECSIDYSKNSQIAQDFFATVQNKLKNLRKNNLWHSTLIFQNIYAILDPEIRWFPAYEDLQEDFEKYTTADFGKLVQKKF